MNKKEYDSRLLDLTNEKLFQNDMLVKNLIETPKEELVNILLEFAHTYDGVSDDLKLKYAREDELQDISLNITNGYITKSKTEGKILSEDVKKALSGANQVLDNVYKLILKKDYINVISITMSTLSILIEELPTTEDDNNLIGVLIDKAIEIVDKSILQVSKSKKPPEYKREIYFIIRDQVIMDFYYTWIDWRCEILRTCLPLCEDVYIRDSLIITIEDLLVEGKGNKWHKLLVEKELKSIIFEIKKEFMPEEDAINYAEKNIEYGYFKNIAIKTAFEKKQFEKVVYLANREAINIGRDYSEYIDEYLFNSYIELGDKENQRILAEEYLLNGRLEYFTIYKKLTSEKDWNETFDVLLELFLEKGGSNYSDSYIKLILLENRYDKLLEVAKKSNDTLLAYGKELYSKYPEETKELLDDYLKNKGNTINGIADYIEIVKIIKVYNKTIGSKFALSLIDYFKEIFEKNATFMEKLGDLEKEILKEEVIPKEEEVLKEEKLLKKDQDKEIDKNDGENEKKQNTKRGKIINMPFK